MARSGEGHQDHQEDVNLTTWVQPFISPGNQVRAVALVGQRGETTECASESKTPFRYASITIMEANDASQFGIGIVAARIAQLVLRDQRAVVPIGSYNKDFGVTLSLPSVIGRAGVIRSFEPEMSGEERRALEASAANLKKSKSSARSRPATSVYRMRRHSLRHGRRWTLWGSRRPTAAAS